MCMSGTPKGMEASLSASFWISAVKASLSPFTKGSMRRFRIFSRISTLFCARHAHCQNIASAQQGSPIAQHGVGYSEVAGPWHNGSCTCLTDITRIQDIPDVL